MVALAPSASSVVLSRAAARGHTEGLIAGAFDRPADPFGAWVDNGDLPPGTWAAFRSAYLKAHGAFLTKENS